jgi:tyrosine-protein phosphatase YwqE
MGFFNRNKSTSHADFSFLEFDMHNHVLSGLDDGAKSEVESIQLINELVNLGFKRIVATPHTMSMLYPNTDITIETAFKQLKNTITGTEIDRSLTGYASEYFIDDNFSNLRAQKKLIPFFKNYVLFEMSYLSMSPNLEQEIFEMQMSGYQPVLAHPERYLYLSNQISYLEKLVDNGCQLQLNLLSLTNHYGKSITKTAKKLMKLGLYDWAATDVHHSRHILLLKELSMSDNIKELAAYPNFRNRAAI